MRAFLPTTLGILITVLAVVPATARAQAGATANPPETRRVTLMATSQDARPESNALVARMVQSGQLTNVRTQEDPRIAGRSIQTLQQVYQGIPVEGGSVTLQKMGGATISMLGTHFDGVSVDVTPAIAPIDAARIIEKAARAVIPFGAAPSLVIVPSPAGTFALAYKASAAYAITYYVDAHTGEVVRVVDEKNYDTGVGTGALGDPKKMATTMIGGTYRAKDTLRPSGISTYDTGGSSSAYDRMINSNNATDADLAGNDSNTWGNGYVVDAHANTGLTYDYFFRRQDWSGLDGNNRPISDIVHSGSETRDNAVFIPAPFGPAGNGVMVYGRSSGGVPVTALDVAGHELMHGVTSFALHSRTGSGFAPVVHTALGPASFVYNGATFPCSTTTLGGRPFFCSGGRYVLGASHVGAINEAMSDVFGTSVEFFNQPAGSDRSTPIIRSARTSPASARFVPRAIPRR